MRTHASRILSGVPGWNHPIRVLHVIRNLHDGGMERLVADLVRIANPRDFDTHVMTFGDPGRYASLLGLHVTLHRAPSMTPLSMLRPAALAAAIRGVAPDVVHTHSGTWYKVARASRMAGVPLVYTEHGRHYPDPWLNQQLDRYAARLTARVVAVSRALGTCLEEQLGVGAAKVVVITNGVDVGRLDALRSAATRRPKDDAVVFGTLGRLERVKAYDVLLAAVAQWPADAPPVRLLIAGDGSQRRALEELARRMQLGDRVQFFGWVEQTERFYSLLDAFVLSSRSEGTSISLLEAMACRCPPVVTDVGGNGEVLGEGLADWLVPAGDANALASKMVAMARSAARRKRLGATARARVTSAYDLLDTSRRYGTLYGELVARAGRVSPGAREPSSAPPVEESVAYRM